MKKCKLFSAAVMGTAAVIVLAGFLTACKQGNGPGGGGNTPAPEKVTVTVTGDENVKSIKPEKLTADKGSDWKTVKTKITVKYKDGYEAAGFKLGGKNGAELKDSHKFDKNTTVFAVSKPKSAPANITITVQADSGYELKTPASFEAASGAKWADIKGNAEAKVSLKEGYTALGWKLGGASGADLNGSHTFTESTIVFAVSKQNGAPVPEKITITVKGDDGVELAAENTFKADKNAEWKNIKASAMGKITVKENYEFAEWRLNGKTGEVLTDTKTFAADTTVFAVTKIKECTYKVEHWQQNIADNEYTKADTETKTGKAGEDTAAKAKTYAGFTAKPVTQEKIKADDSTVVKVYYDRNEITLTLNLNGGTTTTPLTDGNKLKGKFGAAVTVADPAKSGLVFAGWNPDLPKTFPEKSPAEVYVAQWDDSLKVKIAGDERTEIPAGSQIELTAVTTWENIKAQVLAKVNLKAEWQGGDYALYEWRLKDETGEKLTDGYTINKSITVYAVTNYTKFKIEGNKISGTKGYTGDEPRGRIIIPEDITEIGERAFENCTEAVIKVPANVQKIERFAFYDCKKVIVPNYEMFKKVRASRYNGEIELTGQVEENSLYYSDSTKTVLIGCAKTISGEINISSAVVTIADGAFNGNREITGADLSVCTNLTAIGNNAFFNCMKATITLPANVETIGLQALDNCKKIIVPNYEIFKKVRDSRCSSKIEFLGRFEEGGLYYLDSTKTVLIGCADTVSGNITIPSTVVIIAVTAFKGNREITGADLSGCTNLTAIEEQAFENCTEAVIKLPANVQTIENRAFNGCKKVIVPNYEMFKKVRASRYDGVIELPGHIEENGIYYLDSTKTVVIGCEAGISGEISISPAVVTISTSAFENKQNITGADLSGCTNLTAIEKQAFFGCKKATIKLPTSVQTIGQQALDDCKKIIVPNYEIFKKARASHCRSEIEIEGQTEEGGLYYSDSTKTVVIGCTNTVSGEINIPSTVVTIAASAFEDKQNITGADLSGCTNLTAIEEEAFSGCTEAVIKLPASVQTIEGWAFSNCKKLIVPNYEIFKKVRNSSYDGEIELPGRFEESGLYYSDSTKTVVIGCADTVSGNITIPSTVVRIESLAFLRKTGITEVDFSGCANLTEIGAHAFSECESLTSLDLSGCTRLTDIEQFAFSICEGLTSVNLPASLTTIGNYAFYHCTGLTSITFPARLTKIEIYAFCYCTSLKDIDLSGCTNFTVIKEGTFKACSESVIKLPANVQTIETEAFGFDKDSWCKKVLLKSGSDFNRIKKLVTDTGYPKNRIGQY